MRPYERFLKYIQIDTTSNEKSASSPTTPNQLVLAKRLCEELHSLGVHNAVVDNHGYVYAHLAPTKGYENAPRLGFLAHMDTSEDAPGAGIQPRLLPDYDATDVFYPRTGQTMTVKQYPFLQKCKGKTLITSDGTTLLGADDKAGIAEIMSCVEKILSKAIPHGFIGICFTPDEEVGEGTQYFDRDKFGCDFAFTVDGGAVNEIETENFNAATATVEITGFSAHPGQAKDVMLNSQKVAMAFHEALPQEECPEQTEKKEGFFHLIESMGDVVKTTYTYLIRDFDKERFLQRKALLQSIADALNETYSKANVTVTIQDSYYNMKEQIDLHPHLIQNAKKAIERAGMSPALVPIRGGTDGASLSYLGLPCPNLGTGGYNFHSTFECITAEDMDSATDILCALAELYAANDALRL